MILILFSNKNFEYQSICSIKSIENKIADDIKILYFTIDFDSSFECKNLHKIRIGEIQDYPLFNYYKPELCLKALELFPEETDFIYADSDILYSSRFEFKNFKNEFDYPLASCGPHEYPYTYEQFGTDIIVFNEVKLMNYFNVEKRSMWYLFSCFFTFNKNCADFFEEWMSMCRNKYLLNNQKTIYPFKDETSFNICLWKRNVINNLGFVFVNTHKSETIEFIEETSVTEYHGSHWEYVKNSKDIVFYHGFKEESDIKNGLEILLKKKVI